MKLTRPKIACLGSFVLLLACSGQIVPVAQETGGAASKESGDPSSPDGGSPVDAASPTDPSPSLGGLDPSLTIASLTDAQAGSLCTWLAQEFDVGYPNGEPSSTPTVGVPTGYANGPAMGCTNGNGFSWVLLNAQDCVLNLRHSPCAATLSSLAQCVSVFTSSQDFSAACTGSCSAFSSATSCSETVFQSVYGGKTALMAPCSDALPIEPGATCDADGGD